MEAVAVCEPTVEMRKPLAGDAEQRRADVYGLFAVLLARAPDSRVLSLVAGISGSDTPLGNALAVLSRRAAEADPNEVEREYHELFIGLGRGELMPYASFYLTGFLNEKPLEKLRGDLSELGIGRAESTREPEDHIACLCEVMQALITGALGAPAPLERQRRFFETHIAPWAGHFFADLENARNADFFELVGAAGRLFLEIEAQAFRMEG